jgi:hypothetical protein
MMLNDRARNLRHPRAHCFRYGEALMNSVLLIAAAVAALFLLLWLTPLMPRRYVGRRWLAKRLQEARVTYPLPQACLEEVVSDAYTTAKIVAKAPYAHAGFNEIFMRRLNEAARFFQIWTRKDESFERFEGPDWEDLVALANRYNIPRGSER